MAFQRQDIVKIVQGGWEARILTAAAASGILDALSSTPASAKTLAGEHDLDVEATEILLNALASMGLVYKRSSRYAMSAQLRKLLSSQGSQSITWLLRHHNALAAAWAGLDSICRAGRLFRRMDSPQRQRQRRETFIRAMHANAQHRAPLLAGRYAKLKIKRMLDVGGGSGLYCVYFCRRHRGMAAVLFDLPGILPITQEILAAYPERTRIRLVGGDFTTTELPSGFDFILLSHVIHSHSPKAVRDLLGNIRQALDAGGRLVLQDFLTDASGTSPRQAAVFAVNMLVQTEAGRTYSGQEVEKWLRHAGFRTIRRVVIADKSGGAVLEAR